ncbi:hypothetical protein BHE74_00019921 [Ensete ventricosum]|nr:hypothetical protein BHE74_00019921 [Ensete ventricosum]
MRSESRCTRAGSGFRLQLVDAIEEIRITAHKGKSPFGNSAFRMEGSGDDLDHSVEGRKRKREPTGSPADDSIFDLQSCGVDSSASVHETVKRLKELLRIAGFPELALAFDVFLPKGWDAPAPSVSERKPDYRDALNHVRRVRVKRMRCGIVSSSPQDEERPTNSNDAPAGEKEGSSSLYADCNLSTLEHSKSEKYVERHSAVGTDQRGSSKIGMVQKETQKNLNNLLPVQKPSRRFDHCVAEPPQKGDEAT